MEKRIKIKGLFAYIHACPPKGYGPKWHNLTNLRCWISILQLRGPKWHAMTSSKACSVFNSYFKLKLVNHHSVLGI
jgi:hypothetical protein